MTKFWKAFLGMLTKLPKVDLWDFSVLAGAAIASLGVWEIHQPTAKIVAGVFLIMYGIRNG